MLLRAVQKLTLNTIGIFVNFDSGSAYSYIMGEGLFCKEVVIPACMVFVDPFFQNAELLRAKYRAYKLLNQI